MATRTATVAKKAPAKKAATPKAGTFTAESRPGMTFTYEEVTAPIATRAPRGGQPNPHTDGVKRAIELMESAPGKGLSITVPLEEAKKHLAWLRAAGAEKVNGVKDVSIKVTVTEDEKAGKAVLIFVAGQKITRQRKPKDETATAAA